MRPTKVESTATVSGVIATVVTGLYLHATANRMLSALRGVQPDLGDGAARRLGQVGRKA